ncbi:MAG TPA: GNAT family N-acetyltransferase [Halobacteriales archaeon]|nr:GNAT family N-acetyltransferase [Halobacteriales archaeon]
MDVRPADESDAAVIGRVFRRSLEGSYALSPQVIDDLVEAYSGDDLADRLSEEGVYLVAEADGRVVGFAEGRMAGDGVGELVWLHVAPAGRGEGAGTGLFERTREELGARGADHVRARVLADNREGEAFLERFGLRELAETPVEHAGVEFTAHVYADDEESMTRRGGDDPAVEPSGDGDADLAPDDDVDAVEYAEATEIPDTTTDEGRELYVGTDDPIPGSDAPFFRTFDDEAREEHYGYYCSNCGSTEIAMDELERLECSNCGNVHRADEWDAAYL